MKRLAIFSFLSFLLISLIGAPLAPASQPPDAQAAAQTTPVMMLAGHATGLTRDWTPVFPQAAFPTGTPTIYTSVYYANMTDGTEWSYRWYLDGSLYEDSGPIEWSYGPTGYMAVWYHDDGAGMSRGTYEVQVVVEDKVVLSEPFVILDPGDVLNALEQASIPEDMMVAIQCGLSIGGLELFLDGQQHDAWRAVAELQLAGETTTPADIFQALVDLPDEDTGEMLNFELSLEEMLAVLADESAAALAQPDNPNSAFYVLLNGGYEPAQFRPGSALSPFEAYLMTTWLVGGYPGLGQRAEFTAAHGAGTGVHPAPPTPTPTPVPKINAYIFIGSMKGLSGFTGYVDDARDALERHFMANGWIVTRLSGAAANDSEFMRVVQDPATAAVGFIGHADTGAIMWDSGLTEAHNVPDVKTLHGGLEEVILLGCKAGRAEYKSGVGLARFADRLVVNPAAQFVASEYSLAPWDLSRIAKEVETKSPLSDVDTVPSFLTRVCFTIQNIFGADRTLPEAPKIDIHATPIMPDISPVGWAEMRMAEQYMMMGISPPAK